MKNEKKSTILLTMFESWLYPEIPVKNGKILLYKLPEEYTLMNFSPVMDTHIVHESEKSEKFRNKGSQALCGRIVGTEVHRRQEMHRMCDHCLQKLDDKMSGAMFDEKKQEFYLPLEQ